jgi:hypothetical protein
MTRHGSWDDDGSSLSESLLRFVHGDDELDDTPAPRPVTQALALTPATRERTPHKPKDNSDLDELTFYYSPEEPGVRGEVRVGLDRSFDRYDEDDEAAEETTRWSRKTPPSRRGAMSHVDSKWSRKTWTIFTGGFSPWSSTSEGTERTPRTPGSPDPSEHHRGYARACEGRRSPAYD